MENFTNIKTIEKEKLALLNMANTIKKVSETIAKNKKLTSDRSWVNYQFTLYDGASDLAVKIMLEELGIRATKKRVEAVSHWLEEDNFHCPVEAVLNIKEEITATGDVLKIWKPENETLTEHYLNKVKKIVSEFDVAV